MGEKQIHIGIVDDDPLHRERCEGILQENGFQCHSFSTGQDYLIKQHQQFLDIILLDYKLTDMTGLDLLPKILEETPITKVIIVTAFGNLDLAVSCIKAGAFDFVRKPVKREELLLRIEKTIEYQRMNSEIGQLKELVRESVPQSDFIYRSRKMKKVVKMAMKAAQSDATILIAGETGTGKDRVAEIVHLSSKRDKGPFMKINTAAIPESLIESELFGAEKGAFTGADKRMVGKFEAAHHGTIFLDEITELPLSSQVKLLRVIQEKEIYRLGSSNPVKIDVRIIAASNRDIEQLVKEKKFREDLYYRLNVIRIHIPSLKERKEDIPPLIDHFIEKFAQQEGKPIDGMERNTLKKLLKYHFPGNIRELENIIERAVIMAGQALIQEEDIGLFIDQDCIPANDLIHSGKTLPEIIEEIERQFIDEAMEACGGIKVKAAEILGISERVLRYRMEQLAQKGGTVPPPKGTQQPISSQRVKKR